MPISRTQVALGKKLSVIIRRSDEFRQRIPEVGMSGGNFADHVLYDVDPCLHGETLDLLHRRKVVHVSRQLGHVRVYADRSHKPLARPMASPALPLIKEISPRVLAASEALERIQMSGPDKPSPSALETVRTEARNIVAKCRKHASTVPLAEIRRALWLVVPIDVMKAVAFQEPALDRNSKEGELYIPTTKARRKRVPGGLSTEEKVLFTIERAERAGVRHTDILKGIRPLMTAAHLRAIMEGLEEDGRIVSAKSKTPHRTGRPTTRYYLASFAPPRTEGAGA